MIDKRVWNWKHELMAWSNGLKFLRTQTCIVLKGTFESPYVHGGLLFCYLESEIRSETHLCASVSVRFFQVLSPFWWFLLVSSSVLRNEDRRHRHLKMGSCCPEMLHGVVLSPDYDGPCGTPFVGSLYNSNWQTKARDPRGIWPGNSSLLWQPKGVSREEATVPRGGWAMDGWTDGWMEGSEWYLKWRFPCTRVVIISDSERTSGLLRLPLLNSGHQSCHPSAESVFSL